MGNKTGTIQRIIQKNAFEPIAGQAHFF